MISSMTGYGRAREGFMTIELKSVNHRYLDISIRTPRMYAYLEEPVKALIAKRVSRGKIEGSITIENLAAETTKIQLNEPVLEGYILAAETAAAEYGLTNDLTISSVLRLPDITRTTREELDSGELTELAVKLCAEALDEFCGARAREGERLAADIQDKLIAIENLKSQIGERMPLSVESYRTRLTAKMRELLGQTGIDESRILTEAAIFADKVAIDEEIVRLGSHITSLRDMLKGDGAIGRKLDFLVQEFGREANTIGSKCSDIDTSRLVIDLKAEIEKIREQVQNIE